MVILGRQDGAEVGIPFKSVPHLQTDKSEIRSLRQPMTRNPLRLPTRSVGLEATKGLVRSFQGSNREIE